MCSEQNTSMSLFSKKIFKKLVCWKYFFFPFTVRLVFIFCLILKESVSSVFEGEARVFVFVF